MNARQEPRRGAALIFVLMMAAFLATIAGAAIHSAMSGVRAAHVFADIMQADALAHGAGDLVAAYVLADPSARLRGGAFAASVFAGQFAVSYRNEAARIDANTAPADLIENLFLAAGADPPLARRLHATIDAFRQRTPPGRIRSPLEIGEAWGVPDPLARAVMPALTIANSLGKIDPSLAERPVVAALMGGEGQRVDDFLERRGRGFVNADSVLLLLPATSRPFVGFEHSAAVHAKVEVTTNSHFRRDYDLILTPPSKTSEPVKVHFWRPVL